MTKPDLVKLADAAIELNLPKASLRRVAEMHGFIIKAGRSLRVDRNDYVELIKRCRGAQ